MPKRLSQQWLLDITVFVCGAVVMIFEIVGSRILSPFIGASTYVWTSLIGVILGSLSLGYWLGGRLADRKPDLKLLSTGIFFAGGAIAVTVLIKEVVLSMIASLAIGIEFRSVAASLILFAPASVFLGIVTPFAIRLRMLNVEDSGKTVGRLYALSTLGSIIGTFAAGFYLLPFVGSVRTLYALSVVLIALSLLLVPFSMSKTRIAILTVFVFAVISNETSSMLLREANDLYDIDTQYSRVQVFRTTEPHSGMPIRALATDPYFLQSAMLIEGDGNALEYGDYYHLMDHFRSDIRRTLVIGGAGYSLPKDLLRRYDKLDVDVVEIDPQMTSIARRFFRLKDYPRLSIFHEDGRAYLRNAESGRYQAILMDAFGSLFSVPYQLTTIEAVSEMDRVLDDKGIVIFNLGSAITGDASKFLEAELATYRQVFPNVYVFKINSDYPDDRLQNLILIAAKLGADANMSSDDPHLNKLLQHHYTGDLQTTVPVLTDDLAPVEYYNAIAQNVFLSSRK